MSAWRPIATNALDTAPLETLEGPAFEVVRAAPAGASPPTPLVFASPHSGDAYPPDMIAAVRLPLEALRASEDAFVDQVIAGAPRLGATVIRARFARA